MYCDLKKDSVPARETLTPDKCPVRWAYDCVCIAKEENCGKTVMCRDGMTQLKAVLGDLISGQGEAEDIELVRQLCKVISTTPGCELAVLTAENVLWSMEQNTAEWEAHRRRRCSAMECYYDVIALPDKCTGCGKCPGLCPVGAIDGGAGLISVVDNNRCTSCGKCLTECPEGALVKAGLVKPALPESPVPVGSFEGEGGGRRRRRRGSAGEE